MTRGAQPPAGWSWSTGERGLNRVRLFEHQRGRTLVLEWFEPRSAPQRPLARTKHLGHVDRTRGKAEALELAAKLLRGEVPRKEPAAPVEPAAQPDADGPLTLGRCFSTYLAEKSPRKKSGKHDVRASKLFLQCWGADRVIDTLSERDWQKYIDQRRSGALRPEGRDPEPVRDRVIEQDLKFVRAAFRWCTRVKDEQGRFLLESDPLRGLAIPKELNPDRPVLAEAEYAKLLEHAPTVDPQFHLAVVLCGETGHRIASVRLLRWDDLDLTAGVVTWPAEHDKIKHRHETPLTAAAVVLLKAERARQGALTGWVFPSRSGAKPRHRRKFYEWWKAGCMKAEIAHRPRLAYHGLRRKFATERLHVPLKTLAALGGWRDTRVLVEAYQHPDMGQLREALQLPARKIERK